ncbi:hypothetical protein ICY20_16205 [Pseudomonas sp. P115]|uniref:NACHT domain-containing protein n=1 Tax=Pseudomonas pisciculturae TaxID=2730413 RepID=UPI0018925632|nr:hypothetical protein [Pseudomonas pisciculturae]MBF6029291.1 hypothetical protein [Pseudomonas pisciculturae]
MSGNAPGIQKKKRAGGAANAMGMNFQAAATAYACVCMLEEEPLAWLEKLCAEPPVPVAVIPESGGPGDDIRIEFKGGFVAEVQVKKGLRAAEPLWKSLDALAKAIHERTLAYGVLVVDPESSKAIRTDLAKDIIRAAKGQDFLADGLFSTWKLRLESLNIPFEFVCQRIRIKIFHGTEENSGDVKRARRALGQLMISDGVSKKAWATLLEEVGCEMEFSGRMTNDSLADMFSRNGFALNSQVCSAALYARYRDWVKDQNSDFAWPGARKGLPLDSRLPLQVCRYEHSRSSDESVYSAVKRYRDGAQAKRYSDKFAMDWLSRFKKRAVVVAGPGLGKTMALKVLAHRYSVDGYFVLSVRLKQVAKVLAEGNTFTFALIETAVENSGLSREAFLSIDPGRWVLLADGLDECGTEHGSIARQLRTFVSGHPGMRAVITTRRVGYETHELEKWAHYEIIPPAKEEGPSNLAKLMLAAAHGSRSMRECEAIAEAQLRKSPASAAISTSPLLLGMSACLLLQYHDLPESKTELYIKFLQLYDKLPPELTVESKVPALTVLNTLGWLLRKKPADERSALESQCVRELGFEGYSLSEAKKQVHIALEHWMALGLIEQLSHQCTELLTFTHLSFAEFLAARHLLEHQPRLLGDVVYDSQWQEVLGYAVELGLSPSLEDDLLVRHEKGDSEALYYALLWSSKFEAAASAESIKRLVGAAIKVLDGSPPASASLHLKAGLGLCKIAPKANGLLDAWVSRHLESADPTLRLIAWGIASQCAITLPGTLLARPAFFDLLTIHGRPFDVHDILSTRVRHEAVLLEYAALVALKSCSEEEIEAFTDDLSADGRLQKSLEFRLQIMAIRDDLGIERKFEGPAKTWADFFPSVEPDPKGLDRLRDRKRRVSTLLAQAFCRGAAKEQCGAFPQFAAFIASAEIDHYNLHEEFGDEEPEDTISFGSTLRDFALFQGLDLVELAEEARAVLYRLDTEPQFSLFDELPLVDVDLNGGAGCSTPKVNVEHAKRNLLAGSKKAQHLAAVLLLQITLCEESLSKLLNDAKGLALGLVCLLIERNRPDRAIELLVSYLQRSDCQQPDYILQSLERLRPSLTDELESLTFGYLTHANPEVVVSAVDLVKVWVQDEHFSRVVLVEQALKRWEGRTNFYTHFDRDVRVELKDLREAMVAVE